MYSYEDRIKAVQLLIKYDLSYSAVIHELGYPHVNALRKWYKEYLQQGDLHTKITRKPKYSYEQKCAAVNYYLEHGKCVNRTCKQLGYPSRPELISWITDMVPNQKNSCRSGVSNVKYTQEQKKEAVVALCSRTKSAREVASDYGTTRENLYNWKRTFLGEGDTPKLKPLQKDNPSPAELLAENAELVKERDRLLKEVHRLQLEKDILEKAAEIIKKDKGITLNSLTNREKAIVIDALRAQYSLKELLIALHMAKSSYEYQEKALRSPDKYAEHRSMIKTIFTESKSRYGYRRIHIELKKSNIVLSEKVVRNIMKEEDLKAHQPKRKRYSSYQGEISVAPENLVQRYFHAENKNQLWLTDVTEFPIPAGKIYLSPIIDCLDGLPIAWTIGTSPNAELTNTMLDQAISTLEEGERPIVHSDRGVHYRWPGWIERMEHAGLTRSMSKKGCSPDNAACEGFFGRLKIEFFYCQNWQDVSIEEFIEQLNEYMIWYGEKRIKISLGGMSPIEYRRSLGLIA